MITMSYDKQPVIDAVMGLWTMGLDTERMAKILQIPQHDAERFLHQGMKQKEIVKAK